MVMILLKQNKLVDHTGLEQILNQKSGPGSDKQKKSSGRSGSQNSGPCRPLINIYNFIYKCEIHAVFLVTGETTRPIVFFSMLEYIADNVLSVISFF